MKSNDEHSVSSLFAIDPVPDVKEKESKGDLLHSSSEDEVNTCDLSDYHKSPLSLRQFSPLSSNENSLSKD